MSREESAQETRSIDIMYWDSRGRRSRVLEGSEDEETERSYCLCRHVLQGSVIVVEDSHSKENTPVCACSILDLHGCKMEIL